MKEKLKGDRKTFLDRGNVSPPSCYYPLQEPFPTLYLTWMATASSSEEKPHLIPPVILWNTEPFAHSCQRRAEPLGESMSTISLRLEKSFYICPHMQFAMLLFIN